MTGNITEDLSVIIMGILIGGFFVLIIAVFITGTKEHIKRFKEKRKRSKRNKK